MAIGEVFLGSFLSPIFQVLLDRLTPSGLNCMQSGGIDDAEKMLGPFAQLDNWKKMLTGIYLLLDDAENRQILGDKVVQSWLEDVRDLAYDLEDLLDEFVLETDKRQQGAESSTSGGLWKRRWLSFLSDLVSDATMKSKMQDIEIRLKVIYSRKDDLHLEKTDMDKSTPNQDAKRLPSTSVEEPCFVGRKEEENQIIKFLTTDVSDTIPTIFSILGLGGVGKTALAKRVFNDPQVASHFEVKAWACVSDNFDICGITGAILQLVEPSKDCKDKDINWLQVNLKENLLGKKFLIVLDDVWNENYEKWTVLIKPFISGAKGSKVIVTTRNQKVASIARALAYPSDELQQHYRIELEGLQQDYCIELLAYHALGVKNFDDHPHLEVIGKKIVDKCKGLPLAVKTLGGLLRTAVEPNEWEVILNSKLWDLPQEPDDILPALRLSYVHLPSHLKRCFAYCAIFPKDYEIERDKLIHWWMAEGLLGDSSIENRWDNGLKNFKELVSRSFFQQGKESRYLMHDLIHDLARSISGATCFNTQDLESKAYENNASLARVRHTSIVSEYFVTSKTLRGYHGMKKIRSFVTLRDSPIHGYLSKKALQDLVSELKYARVLSVTHYLITEVPDSICELKHLRHLDFSYTDIQTLPKSIGAIYNLEALLLRGCSSLIELPQEIEMLCKLQYLDIRDAPKLRVMPSNLANLKILPRFVVGTQKRSRLKELKHSIHPQGELFISELQQVEQVQDAKDVNLHEKRGIDKLALEWAQDFNDSRNDERENVVLDFLQPCINLKILKISYYGGTRFPPWLGSALYVSIVRVDVHGCHNVTLLPMFGQLPSLKELHIHGLNSVREVGDEFYGSEKPFPSLRTLEFNKMSIWQDWSHCDGVPPFDCLQHLIIRDCTRLVGRLPRGLDSLTKLEIYFCPYLEGSPHVISLPSLQELYFINCNVGILNSLVDLKSLTTLEISIIPELTCFESGFTKSLVKLERLKIEECEKLNYLWRDSDEVQYLTSLRSLSITRCPHLASLMAMPPYLQNLDIIECDSLPASEFESGRFPASLKTLEIQQCRGMESITRIFGLEHQWVEKISISGCCNSRSLEFDRLFHLKELFIMDYNALEVECFPPLPNTVSHFMLWRCANVKYLPNNLGQLSSLKTLTINSCENIRCFPEGGLPPNLKSLQVTNCGALEVECFPPLSIAISHFWLGSCPNIKCLPNNLYQLISLTTLIIWNCGNIKSLPERGLPPDLQQFDISGCENMKTPVREWGLHRLTSLGDLCIDGSVGGVGEKSCFAAPIDDEEEDGAWGFLPSSITELEIRNMREGERLSSGLCDHLPSLRGLWITNCPKLRYFPKDGLPPSLEQLHIKKCGRLEEEFSKPNGDYCHLFHELPRVQINGEDRN